MKNHAFKAFNRLILLSSIFFAANSLSLALVVAGEATFMQTNVPVRDYHFDRTISRPVLENYLSRSISMEGIFNGRGDLSDNIRMIKRIGAKYVGRSLCLWNGEANFTNNIKRAKEQVSQALSADPDLILEACVFETASPEVERLPVPDWVFLALGRPVEKRNFVFTNMIYSAPEQRRSMGRNAQVPDESRIETQLWFYYQAASYIECGFEGIHFGQVEIMNKNDRENKHWEHLFSLVRKFAATRARRHMILLNGHVPSGGLQCHGNPLLDFNAFPLRVVEVSNQPQEAILKSGFSDSIYNRSKGGVTFSGWSCDHLPYLVELDNYGVSGHPGHPNVQGSFDWVWGYDEITWFAHQTKQYRANWLKYSWDWVRHTDPNGYLEMPGGRTATSQDIHWYFANNPGPAVPTGLGDEDAIHAIWSSNP